MVKAGWRLAAEPIEDRENHGNDCVCAKPKIMVSSSVYQNAALLDQIYAALTGYGYEVWMSHKGTLPHNSTVSNLDNCLKAVDDCDGFLGIISPFYGSGRMPDGKTITHHELLRAVTIDKLRWILTDYRVPFARQILKQYRFDEAGAPIATFAFEGTAVLDDVGVIEMYEDATGRGPVTTRRWVHEYRTDNEALFYISQQLHDPNRVSSFGGGGTP